MTRANEHGGALDAMRELFPDAPEPWVDLSTGINPWPWPLAGRDDDTPYRLPTRSDRARCAAAMARAFRAPEQAVLVAPGSEILIRLLPTLLHPQSVTVLSPSYGDHAQVWRASGCRVVETSNPLDDADHADAVVICNPNNPDGRRFESAELEEARIRLRRRNGWLIVDEAFADLEPGLSAAPRADAGNLVVLRSTGKFFGLAGLRLGALLGPPNLLQSMAERLGVWSVSTPALAAGTAAYADQAWQTETRQRLAQARERLDRLLKSEPCRVVGGTDLFRYVAVDDAHGVWQTLAAQGVYVRRFPWTDRHLRIGLPRDPAAEARLLDTIKLLRNANG